MTGIRAAISSMIIISIISVTQGTEIRARLLYQNRRENMEMKETCASVLDGDIVSIREYGRSVDVEIENHQHLRTQRAQQWRRTLEEKNLKYVRENFTELFDDSMFDQKCITDKRDEFMTEAHRLSNSSHLCLKNLFDNDVKIYNDLHSVISKSIEGIENQKLGLDKCIQNDPWPIFAKKCLVYALSVSGTIKYGLEEQKQPFSNNTLRSDKDLAEENNCLVKEINHMDKPAKNYQCDVTLKSGEKPHPISSLRQLNRAISMRKNMNADFQIVASDMISEGNEKIRKRLEEAKSVIVGEQIQVLSTFQNNSTYNQGCVNNRNEAFHRKLNRSLKAVYDCINFVNQTQTTYENLKKMGDDGIQNLLDGRTRFLRHESCMKVCGQLKACKQQCDSDNRKLDMSEFIDIKSKMDKFVETLTKGPEGEESCLESQLYNNKDLQMETLKKQLQSCKKGTLFASFASIYG